MKKIIIIIFLLLPEIVFSQNSFLEVVGYWSQGDYVLQHDSSQIQRIIKNFNIDMSKYNLVTISQLDSLNYFQTRDFDVYLLNIDGENNREYFTHTVVSEGFKKENKYLALKHYKEYVGREYICVYIF